MILETPPYEMLPGFLYWAIVVVGVTLLALAVGFLMSLASYGSRGPAYLVQTLVSGTRDLTRMSSRRFLAIATLTFKEAYHRKAFMVFVVFILLFMFGGWFLTGSDKEEPAKVYVSFVMTCMRWLLIPMALLVSCWGLPADIKDRSLHTVVTKPVRRSEIVLGRMLGYTGVLTLVLFAVSVVCYVWVQRQVPVQARNQLIARVPVYSNEFLFLDRAGTQSAVGTNVGDPWTYRGYVEGLTKAKAIWKFENIDVDAIRQQGGMRLEQKFEAFRTYKGDVNEQIRYSLTLVNPANTQVLARVGHSYPVQEFSHKVEAAVVDIPLEIRVEDFAALGTEGASGGPKTLRLIEDLIDNGSLIVEVACIDAQQFVGVAQNDLFIRMPDRGFGQAYFKAVFSIWLMLVLIVGLGTTASCFLKGPVATMLTLSLIVLGYFMRGYINDQLVELATTGKIQGGGVLSSLYRLPTHMNPQQELSDNTGMRIIQTIDTGTFYAIGVIQNVIPNFSYFDTDKFVANGFDISWDRAILPSLMTTLGFLIPLLVLGYFSLQLRELESK